MALAPEPTDELVEELVSPALWQTDGRPTPGTVRMTTAPADARPFMPYADDPKRLARLLRDLAKALEDSGVAPSGTSDARHLMDDAHRAANELDPNCGKSGRERIIGF
ncbi:hypothetical protein [Streptomyces mirabilis]|uniref:hypothetical protein n=1 Tax=Streptomyces mirabilis TaxID=68239 RepID=UPI00332B10B9